MQFSFELSGETAPSDASDRSMLLGGYARERWTKG